MDDSMPRQVPGAPVRDGDEVRGLRAGHFDDANHGDDPLGDEAAFPSTWQTASPEPPALD